MIEIAPKIWENQHDYAVMSEYMLGATLALNDMIRMGVTQDWATHMIGHELTALHGLTHGATLAIVINGTLRVLREQKRGKLLQYGERIWGIADGSEEERIDRTLEPPKNSSVRWGFSTRLSEEGDRRNDDCGDRTPLQCLRRQVRRSAERRRRRGAPDTRSVHVGRSHRI